MRKELSLCDGAYEALLEKKPDTHDKLILDEIFKLSKSVDGIILAQGSMARLIPHIKDKKINVLTSPESGVKEVIKKLKNR